MEAQVSVPQGLWSHVCGFEDLCLLPDRDVGGADDLALAWGWTARWVTEWRLGGTDVDCPVRDLGSLPLAAAEPVRRFGWRTRQRHRPGLQFMVSTGRHHGFESLEEQRLLLALDFAGDVVSVCSQPFRLRFATGEGQREHYPDFLVVTGRETVLVNVKPQRNIRPVDRVCFAAADEVALAAGWRHVVVAGWRGQALAVLDTLSSQRRPLNDPLGLRAELLAVAAAGPVSFGELVSRTTVPVMARAHALHLLWWRRLGVDLCRPLADRSAIVDARQEAVVERWVG
jgi:hypothetical protein